MQSYGETTFIFLHKQPKFLLRVILGQQRNIWLEKINLHLSSAHVSSFYLRVQSKTLLY